MEFVSYKILTQNDTGYAFQGIDIDDNATTIHTAGVGTFSMSWAGTKGVSIYYDHRLAYLITDLSITPISIDGDTCSTPSEAINKAYTYLT